VRRGRVRRNGRGGARWIEAGIVSSARGTGRLARRRWHGTDQSSPA
jgi:hypothetical protein